MTTRDPSLTAAAADDLALATSVRVLVIEAHYYPAIMAPLVEGALEVLHQHRCQADRFAVPGALEIPQALELAVAEGLVGGTGERRYAGVIVLGCVIRGETSHYDIVCNVTNRSLMDLALNHRIPLGNAILTVENEAQALERAEGGAKSSKGADAARACLRLVWLRSQFHVYSKAFSS
jgi:6,7-dimethyl-8-ribityllumazine synthase